MSSVTSTTGFGRFIVTAGVRTRPSIAGWHGRHTFWPQSTEASPFSGPFDAIPVAVAFVPLWRYKIDIMEVIGAYALLGPLLATLAD